MVHQQRSPHESSSEIVTHALAAGPTESLATRPMSPLPSAANTWARHALLDWFGVAIGGSHEPLTEILIDEALEDGSQECHQGFGATQSTTFAAKPLLEVGDAFGVQSNLFKHHACCYLIHASIEATKDLRDQHSITAGDISQIYVRIPRAHLRACNIPEPRTGTQVKFSIRHVIAMVLAGLDPGDSGIYTPETAARSDLVAIRSKVQLEPEERDTSCYVAEVSIVLTNRQTVRKFVDVGLPEMDIERRWQRLERKFIRLAESTISPQNSPRG